MKCEAWVKRLLQEHDLNSEVGEFLACIRTHTTIDRHVAVVMPEIEDMPKKYAACRGGLALLHHWERLRHKEFARFATMSSPQLVIDDAWLADKAHATVPHVRVSLARTEEDLPRPPEAGTVLVRTTGDKTLDALLFDGTAIVKRQEGKSSGAWIVSLV